MPNEKIKRKLLPITPHGVGRGLSNWGLPSLVTISDSSLSCCQGGGRFKYCPSSLLRGKGGAPITISTLSRDRACFWNLELVAHQDLVPIRIVSENWQVVLQTRD